MAMKTQYDVVVIGSGFGGAITAHRVAEAGRSVAILEKGRRWRKEQFPRTIGRVSTGFWQEARSRGFIEYRTFRKMDVIQGVGVGGGSLHYFNVHVRAPRKVFETLGWPKAVRRSVLDPYYDLVQQKLESAPLEPPAGMALPPRTEAFMASAQRTGKRARLLDLAVYTGEARQNGAGVPQSACVYCGNCMLGCHVHAKNTLDITYIAEAEKKFGLEVFPLHEVSRIAPLSPRGYRVEFSRQEDGAGSAELGHVDASSVIVAAGTLGSTELLLRCRDVHRTLPRLGQALGTRFSGNGDFLFAGAYATRDLIDPAYGPSITAAVDCSTAENLITVEDLGYPDPLLWFTEGALPPRAGRLALILQLAKDYIVAALGFGGESSRVSKEIAGLLAGGRTARFLPYLGMGTDAADGVLKLKSGNIDLVWSHRKSRRMFRQMEAAMAELASAAGGRYSTSFLWRWPLRKLLTAHPLGGCPMGDDPDFSVVNSRGEVWNYPDLYVTDGAAIPSALSVNPSLTIGAIAERAAWWMLNGREWRGESRPRV